MIGVITQKSHHEKHRGLYYSTKPYKYQPNIYDSKVR